MKNAARLKQAASSIERRSAPVTVVHLSSPVGLGDGVEAVITEEEGTTAVVSITEAERRGWPVEFAAAWLTVSVHSSLDAVGRATVPGFCRTPFGLWSGTVLPHSPRFATRLRGRLALRVVAKI